MSVADGRAIAAAAIPLTEIEYHPWLGSRRSVPATECPQHYSPSGADFRYLPRKASWLRRGGQTIQFDDFGSPVGLLPSKWGAKARWMEQFLSDAISDSVPTLATLLTKETVASGLDDGRFSTLWLRDQVNGLDYTLASEFGSNAYPAPGSLQYLRMVPLWYESGDGGITRGASEFARRFIAPGSRRFKKVGRKWYFPSRYGTPARWDGGFTAPPLDNPGLTSTPSTTASGGDSGTDVWASSTAGDAAVGGATPNLSADIDEGIPGDDATTFIRSNGTPVVTSRCVLVLDTTIPSVEDTYTVRFRAAVDTNSAANQTYFFQLYRADGAGEVSSTLNTNDIFDDVGANVWGTYEIEISIGVSPSLSPVVRTCTTNGTTALTSSSAFGALGVGMAISGTGIPAGTTIASIASASALTMSQAATDSSAASRTFAATSMLGIKATGTGRRLMISAIEVTNAAAEAGAELQANRIIPSGPIPPCHAGYLSAGNAVTGSSGTVFMRPSSDVDIDGNGDGGWLGQDAGTDLYTYLDDDPFDDTNYIVDAGAAGNPCGVGLNDPGFTPTSSTHTALVSLRGSLNANLFGATTLIVNLIEDPTGAATVRATHTFSRSDLSSGSGPTNARWLSFYLAAAEIDSVTDWSDLAYQFEATSLDGVRIHYAALELTAQGEALSGGWRGYDRFFFGVAYVFEDDSVWMPTMGRFPNDILTDGLNLFTVDPLNTATAFDKVIWHLPRPPEGVRAMRLMRSDKINSTADDNLQLSPFALYTVAEVGRDVDTYDDYFADDDSLTVDDAIRFDHRMPPRARYIFDGDMRICHSYGGENPCAIVLAPTGREADWDIHGDDDLATLYDNNSSYMRVTLDTAGAGALELVNDDGATPVTVTLSFTTYNTIQKLVDRINATTFGVDGLQWRAQICPAQSTDADPAEALTPNYRQIASCVVSGGAGGTITKAAGGLSKVAVGDLILRAGVATSAYVSRIDSDTQLTYSGTITAGTITCQFYKELGDTPTGLGDLGYQRVIANSLPGFLYFNATHLNKTPIDRSSVWMTVAGPGSEKSAANSFSAKLSNKFTPPGNPGISMGGGGVDHGFVVPFANGIYAIRNTRDTGSGEDADYRIQPINENRGCCAWNTVVPGNRFIPYMTPEGLFAADLHQERNLDSDVWNDDDQIGDYAYELPLCIAATHSDTDGAYLSARIMQSVLYLNFRASGSHPNRQTQYDFSTGAEGNGLASLFRPGWVPWGWSQLLTRSMTAMCEGVRSDGAHIYGWNEQNAGSVGDGRVDEFEIGDDDNGTAITGNVAVPWTRNGRDDISAQEIVLEHVSPVGSTGSLVFHRGYADTTQTLTPSAAGGTPQDRDLKLLNQDSRSQTKACYISYHQATGGARELRTLVLRAKMLSRALTPS